MPAHEGGQGIPEIEREEHQHNLHAKRTVILDGDGNQVTSFGLASGTASTVNSTTTPLTGSATFTGAWENITDYDFLEAILYTDVNSATNGAKVLLSTDGGVTTAKTLQNTITGGVGAFGYTIPVTAYTHFKVTYTNGSSAQSVFQLRVAYQKGAAPAPYAPLGAGVDATYSALLTRAVLAGQLPSGAVQNLSVNASGYQEIAISEHDVDTPIKSLTSGQVKQVSVATNATPLDSSPLNSRKTVGVKVHPSATDTVYVGFSNGVTTTGSTGGWMLAAGDSEVFELTDGQQLWAIVATTATIVAVMELA